MITRLKLSTIEQGLPKYRSMLAGNDAYIPNSFESIATATGTGSSGVITFSSIPSTYQHLQLRCLVRDTSTGTYKTQGAILEINSDTGNNYSRHSIRADGASIFVAGAASQASIQLNDFSVRSDGTSNTHAATIIDIHDYASTSKNKTIRAFGGANGNTSDIYYLMSLYSGAWLSTSAINSLRITAGSGNFSTSSTFALYGIKGA